MAFLSVMLEVLRNESFRSLIHRLVTDASLARKPEAQMALVAPFLHASAAYIGTHPLIPISALQIEPQFLGLTTSSQRDQSDRMILMDHFRNPNFFRVSFRDVSGGGSGLTDWLNGNDTSAASRTRGNVLSEAVSDVKVAMEEFMARLARIENLNALSSIDSKSWLMALRSGDDAIEEALPRMARQELGDKLLKAFIKAQAQLWDKSLVENARRADFEELATYDAIRLFMIAMDRAVVSLPWDRMSNFLVQSVATAARDMSLGQKPGVQQYLFNTEFSLLRPSSLERLTQTIASHPSFNLWKKDLAQKMDVRFNAKCARLLEKKTP